MAPTIRPGTVDDMDEVLRLAHIMWGQWGSVPTPEWDWEQEYRTVYAGALGRGDLQLYVAESPEDPTRLVACGAAWQYRLLPAPWLINGKMGYLQWFSTEPEWRGQGLGTEIAVSCVAWLREQGCTRIQLHAANPHAADLYRRLGFNDDDFPNFWLRVPLLKANS